MNETIPLVAQGALIEPQKDPRAWTGDSVGASVPTPSICHITGFDKLNVTMQSQIGCCVGSTGEEMVRKIVYIMTGQQDDLSWRFVYALAKCVEGKVVDGVDYTMYPRTAGANDGTYPALVAKLIRKYGVPLAKFCPNNTNLSPDEFCFHRDIAQIPEDAFIDAVNRRSGADVWFPSTLEGLKQAILYAEQNNGGVMILRSIGNCYWTDANGNSTWDPKKLLPIRKPETITGGHEESATGYEDEPGTGRTKIFWLNHWSKDWADNGRAWEYADVWMPYVRDIRVVVQSVPTVVNFHYTFNKNLERGMQGADVVALQHILKLEGFFPEGQAFTGYYGDLTFAGVKALQEKYAKDILAPVGLKTGTGRCYEQTRKFLNGKYF